MIVFVVSEERQIPHHEFNGVVKVFKSLVEAKLFIFNEYVRYINDKCFGYIDNPTESKYFDDYESYIYSEDGYFICWKIEEFKLK